MLLSAFQQSRLCGSSADAFPTPSLSRPTTLSPPLLDRLWCGDNKTGAVLSAAKWPHWHGTTCGRGRGDRKVQASTQEMRRPQWWWRWHWQGYKCGGQRVRTGEGLYTLSFGNKLRRGVHGSRACEESRCFHSGVCQVCRATFSFLEVRPLIRELGTGHFAGKCFNFDTTTY